MRICKSGYQQYYPPAGNCYPAFAGAVCGLSEDLVTLPYSAHRRYTGPFCMLILRAPRLISTGLGPWGVDRIYFRAGKTIARSRLWPTPDAPREPIVIESTDSPNSKARPGGHEDLHVLWRFDVMRNDWREVARITSKAGEWWPYFHPLLLRELGRSHAAPAGPDLEAIAGATAAYLDAQIRDLTGSERAAMLIEVHDQLAERITAADAVEMTRYARLAVA